jgi:hypothetical protein
MQNVIEFIVCFGPAMASNLGPDLFQQTDSRRGHQRWRPVRCIGRGFLHRAVFQPNDKIFLTPLCWNLFFTGKSNDCFSAVLSHP